VAGEHIQLVREGYVAWNRGDRQWVLDHMSEDFEWITPPDDPDPGSHSGHEAVVRFWDHWREAFGQLEFEPEEMFEVGDCVVSVARRQGIGNVSRVDVHERVYQVFTFKGDKAVRCQEFYDRDAAMQAAGATQAVERTD
jgi:uncharacterized protein